MNHGAHAQRGRSRWVLLLVLLGATGIVDGFFIEPYRLEVTHSHLQAPLTVPLKIAHISDLHTYGLGRRERDVLAQLDAEHPDVIVLTGDTIADHGTYEMVQQVLPHLKAPLGVWLIRGNWENWKPKPRGPERAFYESLGVHFLLNAGARVRQDVWLAGLDDPWTGRPDLESALAGAPEGIFKIVAFHSPIYFRIAAGRCDLAVAGHTHGGQVKLPFLFPLWLPGGCDHFLAGWYEDRGSKMYVSRGIGVSRVPVRFNCRPELAIITIGG